MNDQWIKKGRMLLEEIRDTSAGENTLHIWYVGQMGIVLRYRHTVIAIDPVFNDLTDPDGKSRRNYPPPFDALSFDFADYILCTHAHADHMNMQTLLPIHQADPATRFLVPAPVCQVLTESGIPAGSTIGAKVGEELHLTKAIAVYPVASAHEDYRVDANGCHHFLGYILQCGPFRIYHAGDTLLTDQLIHDLCRFSRYDAVFLPINGRDKERHSRGIVGNMDYREAADLADTVNASLSIPLHHDMVRDNTADPYRFARYMDAHHPGRAYQIMKLGGQIALHDRLRPQPFRPIQHCAIS